MSEHLDIGQPNGNPRYHEHLDDHLTWWWLRRIGFRIVSTGVDTKPHMMASVSTRMETGLEIAPSHGPRRSWIVWLRSDMAHSRARFCYVRNVSTVGQLVRLMESISNAVVEDVDFDADQFRAALTEEADDCQRRYEEYCRDARWGHVPGGL